jgi:hypothetical protein
MAAKRMQIVGKFHPTGLEVAIELRDAESTLGRIVMDAAGLEETIESFGKWREAMAEPVSMNLDPGSRFRSVKQPQWRVQHQNDGTTALFVRHPGFGWLAFRLPGGDAARLAQAMRRPPRNRKPQDRGLPETGLPET